MKKKLFFVRFFMLAVALAASDSASGADEFAALARFLPDDANAIIVVNAEALYASPLGTRDGWKAKFTDAFEAEPLVLPPSAKRCVLAAEFALGSLRPSWEAAAMELSVDPSAADIVKRRGGAADSVGGYDAVWFGAKTCVLKFAAKTFGLITPATRQEAARWALDTKDGGTGSLSPYLEHAVKYADEAGTHVVLAIDLADAFSEATLRTRAGESDVLKGASPDAAAKILASVQGVKFGVKVTDKINGRLQIDFAQDVTPLASFAKPLALQVVGKAGAMLKEFESWNAEATGTSIALSGELTSDGMRRIFSLLALDPSTIELAEPASPGDAQASVTPSPEPAQDAMAKASLRYFRGVGKYVADLQRLEKAQSLDQAILWIENYARKIEGLSTRYVDPELIEYGKYTAQTFRTIVDQSSGVLAQYEAAGDPVVTNYHIGWLPTARTVNYGGNFQRMYAPYANANVDVAATQKRMQQTEDDLYQAVQSARQTLTQLGADHETVRKKLTEKYGLKF